MTRFWSSSEILDAIQLWNEEYGRPPSHADWSLRRFDATSVWIRGVPIAGSEASGPAHRRLSRGLGRGTSWCASTLPKA
jgi:hypothetical protein